MSAVYRQQNINSYSGSPTRQELPKNYKSAAESGYRNSARPYKWGIKINRPKTYSMADKALQIEANRAKRYVGDLNQDLKMPTPRTPAVLAYLRWLDKMDAWYRKSGSVQQTSARLRETEELYSWNSGFGSPIVLPKIRKHPNPEKYSSKQVEERYRDPKLTGSGGVDYEGMIRRKRHLRRARIVAKSADDFSGPTTIGDSLSREDDSGKRTKFYIHAMNNFKYWPSEIYNPPIHHTKYSFGTQFNPGRAGVVTDRIYTRPRANKHYWTEFQLRQNPIGSGNSVTGRVLAN